MVAKKTPIYQSHVEQGGRIVEFAGYMMPVSFEGIVAEHERVRTAVGLFDVSHMGEIEITGSDAASFADTLVTNRVRALDEGQICYTVACNERGKVLDDFLVYKLSESRILLVVNAVNTSKIYEHVRSAAPPSVEIADVTQSTGQIAVQGPASKEVLLACRSLSLIGDRIADMPYYNFVTLEREGCEVIVSRTGYTGEHGYEIYLPAGQTLGLWNELLVAGKGLGAAPIGLGARDTLRFEPGFCLYGNELDEETSPLEAGLSWLVKLKKDRFMGRDALLEEKEKGPVRKLIGLQMEERNIARHGYAVKIGGEEVGSITSGTFAPTLKKSLAMALVARSVPEDVEGFTIDIRGRSVPASLTALPFYRSRAGD